MKVGATGVENRETTGRSGIHPILGMTVLYCLISISIFHANFAYKDDLGRTAEGYRDWYKGSRYISDLLAPLIHTGRWLTDISPLAQILSLFLLATAAYIWIYVYSEGKKQGWFTYAATVPLAFCPYYLMCLSFKYDAPYMGFSVAICFIPLLFVEERKKYAVISVLSILAMCMTYQASSGIYPILVIALAYRKWNQGKWSLRNAGIYLVTSAAAFCLGVLGYKFVFMRYVPAYIQSDMLPLNRLLSGSIAHYLAYWKNVYLDFRKIWLVVIILLVIQYLLLNVRQSKQNRFLALFFGVLSVFLESIMAYGVMLVTENSGYSPRVMYALGTILLTMTAGIAVETKTAVSKALAAALCWCFVVYAFSYGNNLVQMKRTVETRTQEVVDSLNELQLINNGVQYEYDLKGYIGIPEVIKRQIPGCRLTERLLPLMGEGGWGPYYLEHYFGVHNLQYNGAVKQMDLDVLHETSFYTIYGDQQYLLISFHDE